MALIELQIPAKQQNEYKIIFEKLVKLYSINDLKYLSNEEVIFSKHNLWELSEENIKDYKESFNLSENDLVNI